MAGKPDPKADDSCSEEEAARRGDASVKEMLGMKPAASAFNPNEKSAPHRRGASVRATLADSRYSLSATHTIKMYKGLIGLTKVESICGEKAQFS